MKRHVTARHIRNGRSLSTRDNDLNKMPAIRDKGEMREEAISKVYSMAADH